MATQFSKRQFLTGSLLAASAVALSSVGCSSQRRRIEASDNSSSETGRAARTVPLFKCPPGFPNAMAKSREGLWLGEQKLSGDLAIRYGVPEPSDLLENAWLLDWETGEVLRTVRTQSRNTSGMAVGDGYVWMVANAEPYGVFQTDMNSRTVNHKQIPLGGGGCHGAKWHNGKLWIVSTRLGGILRIDPDSWEPEFMIPYDRSKRHHDMAFDDEGNIWLVTGDQTSTNWRDAIFGLDRYNSVTGERLESVPFVDGSADPHGLEWHNGSLYTCDAGIHPNWPTDDSPYSGYVLRIDFV